MSLVLFSGGCDSTLVLYNLLKENRQEQITALSINHNQVPAIEENKKARALFKIEMQKRELNYLVNFAEVDISSKYASVIDIKGLSQPIIWSMIAMLYIRDNDTIYFGYHSGDDFWQYKTEFENAIHNICAICDKKVTIEYPLRLYEKCVIIDMLKKRGLYEYCWYCEKPTLDNKPCGECIPCKLHRTALWQNETFMPKEKESETVNNIIPTNAWTDTPAPVQIGKSIDPEILKGT
jgi:7-cyano-7-deazaguanine synthase in queuosine biosynthesis